MLGLNHSAANNSVMNAHYPKNIRGPFELSTDDRSKIHDLYGRNQFLNNSD